MRSHWRGFHHISASGSGCRGFRIRFFGVFRRFDEALRAYSSTGDVPNLGVREGEVFHITGVIGHTARPVAAKFKLTDMQHERCARCLELRTLENVRHTRDPSPIKLVQSAVKYREFLAKLAHSVSRTVYARSGLVPRLTSAVLYCRTSAAQVLPVQRYSRSNFASRAANTVQF